MNPVCHRDIETSPDDISSFCLPDLNLSQGLLTTLVGYYWSYNYITYCLQIMQPQTAVEAAVPAFSQQQLRQGASKDHRQHASQNQSTEIPTT